MTGPINFILAMRGGWRWMLLLNVLLIAGAMALAYSGRLEWSILQVRGADKLLHALLFGGVAFWIRIGLSGLGLTHKRRIETAVLTALFLAVALDETIQMTFPLRTADWRDLAADLVGIISFWSLAKPAAMYKNNLG